MNVKGRSAGRVGLITLAMCWLVPSAPAALTEQTPAVLPPLAVPAPAPTLTTIISIMGLSREVAAHELPVEVEGVVTCTYAADTALFIFDGQAGAYVANTPARQHFGFGERVRVKGK